MLKWLFGTKTKTVLFVWELGGGLGHIYRLLPVAAELASRGHRVVFALRRLDDAAIITQTLSSARLLQAPVYRAEPTNKENPAAYTYTDILHRCGYDAPENLGLLVQQWYQLLGSLNPALIVCDHSPTVILAAAGRIPVVHIGSGFAVPPAGRPFLTLSPTSALGAKQRETQVLNTLHEVHQRLETKPLSRVCDLLGLAENFACCLPELDPYQSVRPEPAIGPVEKLPAPQPFGEREFVFGYLNGGDARTARILESLAKANVPCGLYIRQCPSEWAQMVAGSAVTLYPTPQKMPEALSLASAIVHHGGSTAQAALALGRPQFFFPRTLDQELMANAVEKMKCGVNLGYHGNPGDAIRRALTRGAYRKESALAAAQIAERSPVDVIAQIVTLCDKHLSS